MARKNTLATLAICIHLATCSLPIFGVPPESEYQRCNRACSPLKMVSIRPCECEQGQGTCDPFGCDPELADDKAVPRWEFDGRIFALDFSETLQISQDGRAVSLERGIGLELGTEYRFNEHIGVGLGIATAEVDVESTQNTGELQGSLRNSFTLTSLHLDFVFHLTPWNRYDLELAPSFGFNLSGELDLLEGRHLDLTDDVTYGLRLSFAYPLRQRPLIGDRWLLNSSIRYMSSSAIVGQMGSDVQQLSLALGFTREF